ncbi:hypothetical protein MMC13_006047 [Lambiella insularis]|nr:hypothetical protein [Lambiella insularis]
MPVQPLSQLKGSHVLHGVPYEATVPGKAPVNITVAPPPPSSARLGVHPLLRPRTLPEPSLNGSSTQFKVQENVRRDSGLAPSNSTARESRVTLTDEESSANVKQPPSLPRTASIGGSTSPSIRQFRKWSGQKKSPAQPRASKTPQVPKAPFEGITTDIPSISFEDLNSLNNVEFSKRGSMLIAGKRANEVNRKVNGHARTKSRISQPSTRVFLTPLGDSPQIPTRLVSAEEETSSQKLRSIYNAGTDHDLAGIQSRLSSDDSTAIEEEIISRGDGPEVLSGTQCAQLTTRSPSLGRVYSCARESFIKREDHELAGGIEDWQDIKGGDVDRYGFIVPRASPKTSSDSIRPNSLDPPRMQCAATLLQLASETPRGERNKVGRKPSVNGSARSTNDLKRRLTRDVRPSSSQSFRSTTSRPSSRVHSATKFLPYSHERRCMDEAGDMLTLPPALADIAEHGTDGRSGNGPKKKEWEREEKWRKMARLVSKSGKGGGMVFDFDVGDPKVVQRTWKGIPDRWRATAWHAFLNASAKKSQGSPTEEELVSSFNALLDQSSPDDVQIDIDVPRTINSHIMFRRRYRGGQRLLFRVLHCLSIYFPDTGYVQGMAALAATLLCYFDEEMTFVMLVRMWQLRGLARLYQPGFKGLMDALDEFEKNWLLGGEVATKLTELGIAPTAYGTRWYLTVFNYSIPFPAQLRVWDVWMLLGDVDLDVNLSTINSKEPTSFNGGLDVLHATSAALIDGTRDILLDSDFENAMKVLTSWIPIRDEDLLMRVAKAEWKMHRRKR